MDIVRTKMNYWWLWV